MSSKNPEAICCASYEAFESFKAFKAAILQDSCGARNGFLTRYSCLITADEMNSDAILEPGSRASRS